MSTFRSLIEVFENRDIAEEALTSNDRCYIDIYNRVIEERSYSYHSVKCLLLKSLMRIVNGFVLYNIIDYGHEVAIGYDYKSDAEYFVMIRVIKKFWNSDAGFRSKQAIHTKTTELIKDFVKISHLPIKNEIEMEELHYRLIQCGKFGIHYFKNIDLLYLLNKIKECRKVTRHCSYTKECPKSKFDSESVLKCRSTSNAIFKNNRLQSSYMLYMIILSFIHVHTINNNTHDIDFINWLLYYSIPGYRFTCLTGPLKICEQTPCKIKKSKSEIVKNSSRRRRVSIHSNSDYKLPAWMVRSLFKR